ncbi:MAG: zinc-binding dehydrogenase [Bacillota bacterium]|jgi:threonine dehydrogenase-like Zn-dependent dehydrogenase|uniref:NADP-dependent isopropanol dehydrogenase n=3 Tax=Herbinix luporum TaxID=1679721 RepID=A0A0K8J5R0_9FIRM|nr:zinc-binding dehydrogenase [Herbinix luporum]MDI9488282.1 zinc-binding dehydrogenase [Bacillota bacterium]CUH92805.1 NADP-dependent isopropanol dehydrogenase [Herbinix luporum]
MKGFGVLEKGKVGWLEKADYVCGPDDAIVRPLALSPCSSDVHSAYEMEGPHLINRILGHESVGEVIEVGSNVKDFKVGDRVAIPCTTPTWKHPDIQDGTHQDAGGMFSAINFSSYEDGTFAEQIKVRSADMNLALIPEGVSLESAVMATDMMTTGFYGSELADVKFGDTVVVFGIGPVGLMAVAGAKLRGAGKLIAVGTRPNCVALAKEYGATDIVSYKDGDLVEQIMKLTDGKGADAAIVAGGGAEALNNAIAVVKAGGGNVAMLEVITETEMLNIPNAYIGGFLSHKTIRGGLCPGGRKRIERLLSLIKNGRVDPSKMITHKFNGLDSIEEAFYLMKDKPRDLIKPIVIMD